MNSSHQRSKLFEQKSSKNRLKEFLIPLRAPSLERKKKKKRTKWKREKRNKRSGERVTWNWWIYRKFVETSFPSRYRLMPVPLLSLVLLNFIYGAINSPLIMIGRNCKSAKRNRWDSFVRVVNHSLNRKKVFEISRSRKSVNYSLALMVNLWFLLPSINVYIYIKREINEEIQWS